MQQLRNYMTFMSWDKTYSVNIRSIDDQHRKIVHMINELHNSVIKGLPRELLDRILVTLSITIIKHFIYEESLFKKHNYKHLNEHKKEHDDLAERIIEFNKKHTIQNETLDENLLTFFKNMMYEHITITDQQYIDFMSLHGVQ